MGKHHARPHHMTACTTPAVLHVLHPPTILPDSASISASCSNSVLLPIPGSPPNNTKLPGTTPPPNTRATSPPVSPGSCSRPPCASGGCDCTSAKRWGVVVEGATHPPRVASVMGAADAMAWAVAPMPPLAVVDSNGMSGALSCMLWWWQVYWATCNNNSRQQRDSDANNTAYVSRPRQLGQMATQPTDSRPHSMHSNVSFFGALALEEVDAALLLLPVCISPNRE